MVIFWQAKTRLECQRSSRSLTAKLFCPSHEWVMFKHKGVLLKLLSIYIYACIHWCVCIHTHTHTHVCMVWSSGTAVPVNPFLCSRLCRFSFSHFNTCACIPSLTPVFSKEKFLCTGFNIKKNLKEKNDSLLVHSLDCLCDCLSEVTIVLLQCFSFY